MLLAWPLLSRLVQGSLAAHVWLVACLLWPVWNCSRWWWRCVVKPTIQVSLYSMESPTVLSTPSVMHRRGGCDVLPSEGPFVMLQGRLGWAFGVLYVSCVQCGKDLLLVSGSIVFLNAVPYRCIWNARLWNSGYCICSRWPFCLVVEMLLDGNGLVVAFLTAFILNINSMLCLC